MTEDEAKTKSCIGPSPYNSGVPGAPNADGEFVYICSGSACMAWRWGQIEVEYGSEEIGETTNQMAFRPPGDGWKFTVITRRWERSSQSGYCGLAGQPSMKPAGRRGSPSSGA